MMWTKLPGRQKITEQNQSRRRRCCCPLWRQAVRQRSFLA
jgi:hypothetical protein